MGLGVQKDTQTPCWLRPCVEPCCSIRAHSLLASCEIIGPIESGPDCLVVRNAVEVSYHGEMASGSHKEGKKSGRDPIVS